MKLVVLDGYTSNPGDTSWQELELLGDLSVFEETDPRQVVQRCDQAEIVITNKVKLNAQTLEQLPNLKMIAVLATGYDVVDVLTAKRLGIVVCNVPEYSTASVAQHVFTGLLALLSRPEQHHQAILDGQWSESGQFSFWLQSLTELAGKKIGIVGLGRIGRAVARLADAFGMQVIASSRSQSNPLPYAGFAWVDQDTLFATADVISLHCPATSETTRMVNRRLIQMMQPSSILINTARGALIDESDLAEALNRGDIAGAFLDVVSVEPIESSNPLLVAKNCLLTPHVGWATIESRRRLLQITADNVQQFIAQRPINVVGP